MSSLSVGFCRDEQDATLSKEHIKQFQEVWVQFDPEGTGVLDRGMLNAIMRKLPYPLGFEKPPSHRELRIRLQRMDIKLYKHKFVTFWDFATGLAKVAFEEEARRHSESFEVPAPVSTMS